MPSVSKSGLKQINKDTLWDKAYFSLKSALLAGKFVPGERIILRKVAQDLGISLTPVRDAINRLAAENVLERGGVGQGGGASVPLLNAHEFDQLMSIRSSLEPLAAEAAANNATKTEISEISKLFDQMRDKISPFLKEETYVIQCWCNIYRTGEKIDWHKHWPSKYEVLHGFYCLQTEEVPSYTDYSVPGFEKEVRVDLGLKVGEFGIDSLPLQLPSESLILLPFFYQGNRGA